MIYLIGILFFLSISEAIRFGPVDPGEKLVYLSPNFFQSDEEILIKRDEIQPYSWSFDHFGNTTEKGPNAASTSKRSSKQRCDLFTQREFGSKLDALTNDAFNGDAFFHESTGGDSSIKCSSERTLLFNEIALTSIEITFKANKAGKLTSFSMKARWNMDGGLQPLETESFDASNGLVKFKINSISDIRPMRVAADHGIQPGELSPQNAVFAGGKLQNIMFRRPTVTGYFNFNGDFQYVMVSDAQTHNPFTKFAKVTMKLFVTSMTVDGRKPSRPKGSFVFQLPPNKNLLEVIKESLTFKIGLRGIPLLKRIHDRPWCIVVAPTDITFMGDGVKEEIRKCFPDMDDVKRIIPKGYSVPISVEFKKAMKDCGAKSNERKSLPDVVTVLGSISMQAVKFNWPPEYDVPIRAAMQCSGAGALSDLPFNLFNENDKEPIFQFQEVSWTPSAASLHASTIANKASPSQAKKIKFNMNKENKMYIRITAVLTLPEKHKKVPGMDAEFGPFKMHFDELLERGKWKITGLAQLKFANGITANVNLAHKMGKAAWKFILQIPSIKLANFMEKIEDVSSSSGTSLDDMGIQDFRLEWNIKEGEIKPISVKIRGNPVIAGYSGAHVEGMWWRADDAGKTVEVKHPDTKKTLQVKQPQNGLALGVFFGNINMDWIIENVFGFKISIPWFSNLKAFLTWTNAASLASTKNECLSRRRKRDSAPAPKALKEICFTIPGIASAPIVPDVNAMILWDIPRTTQKDKRCAGDKMCEFIVNNLQSVQNIQLSLFFNKANRYFAITAKINAQIKLAETLILQEMLMRIAISFRSPFSFKIMGVLVWRDREVIGSTWRFTGSVELKSKSIGFRFTWSSSDAANKPSKIPISFKNILLGGGYSAGVPMIELGMEFWVGSSSDHKNLVKVAAYGGYKIDPPEPPQVWFYGRVNSLSIDSVCKAFDKNCDKFIPKILRESGFNKETTVSFAAEEKSIDEIGVVVPGGFAIIGGINILGVESYGKILNTKGGIEIDINMKPVNWAFGLIKIQRNKEDAENGPRMNVRFTNAPYTYVWIEGYVKVFAFEGEIKIVFHETMAEAVLDGPIFFGLNARTQLKATYGNLKTLSFKMYVDIHTVEFVKDASIVITKFINSLGKKIQDKVKYLEDKLKTARQYVNSAKAEAEETKRSIQRWRSGLQQELKELEQKENEANEERCYAECPRYCVPYPSYKTPCTSYWGWVFGCIVKACSWTRGPICLSSCLVKDVGSSVSTWFTKRKLEVQDWLGSKGQQLIQLAVSFLEVGDEWLKMLQSIVDTAKRLFKGVLNAITEFSSGKIFSLDYLKLSAEMESDFDFCGTYEVKCVLFGYNIEKKSTSCWTPTIVKDLIFATSEDSKELEGLSSAEKNLEEVEQSSSTTDEAENEFKKKKQDAESNTKQQMANEYQKLEKRGRITIQEMESFAMSLPREDNFVVDEEKKKIYEPIERFDSREKLKTLKITEVSKMLADDPSSFLTGVDITPKKDMTLQKRSLAFEDDLSPCGRVQKSLNHYEEITNVLMDNAQNVLTHQKSFDEAKKSDIEQLNKLREDIVKLDNRFNMTVEDHRDAWFLYNQAVTVQQDIERKSKDLLDYHKRSALPIVRRQLNFALKEETGNDLESFFNLVNDHGMEGFKRSNIPTPQQSNGLDSLNRIKKDLESILFNNKDIHLNEKHDDLVNVRSEIEGAKKSAQYCSDN